MDSKTPRLYSDLAWLWPMWGDPNGEYAEWCAHVVAMIDEYAGRHVHTLLNLGCGGGKNAHNLKRHYQVTGLDLSNDMLTLARELNPECSFVQGDMRSFSLPQRFDAILIDDAVSYMTSRADLAALFRTAYRHLEPGGAMIVSPDVTKETFQQNATRVSHANAPSAPRDLEVLFIENSYDPDPTDDTFEGLIIFLIRRSGVLRVETDRHTFGIFADDVWPDLLRAVGFDVYDDQWRPGSAKTYICVKPQA